MTDELPGDELAARAAYAIICVGRRWIARADEMLAGSNGSGGDLAVLMLLKANSAGLTQRELADTLALSEPMLSKRTGELLSKGHISRSKLIGDRRANLLRLTAAGDDFLAEWGGHVARQRQHAVAGITRAELTQAISVLERLDGNLRSEACSRDAVLGSVDR